MNVGIEPAMIPAFSRTATFLLLVQPEHVHEQSFTKVNSESALEHRTKTVGLKMARFSSDAVKQRQGAVRSC